MRSKKVNREKNKKKGFWINENIIKLMLKKRIKKREEWVNEKHERKS